MATVDLRKIATEQRNPRTTHIDELSTLEMVRLINSEDHKVAEAVEAVCPQIAKAVDVIAEKLHEGGRLIYVGCGTSGRLGILDAVECPPTYSTDPEMVQGLIAGGMPAIYKAVEGAEDDRELRQLFQHVLTKNGYSVVGVSNGEEALHALDTSYYDLIISDIMMPKMDGYQLVSALREAGMTTPVMMITAKDAFDDMRLGFLSGSDDYMVKPVNINEMVLRVGALLRRAQMANERRQVIGGTVLECDSLSVHTDKETMTLPQKEFMLLYKMVSFPGRIFTRQQLMDDIWGYSSETDTHTVDVHIGRLRERFRDNPDFKIVTMRGVGYKVVKL